METNRKIESFDEIVFEDRNKEYGAFVLRRSYDKRVTTSLSISLLAVLLAVGYPVLASYMNKTNRLNVLKHDASASITKYVKEEDAPPPPPPPPAEIKQEMLQQVKYVVPQVVDSVANDVILLTAQEAGDITNNQGINEEVGNIVLTKEPIETKVVKNDVPFVIVEEMPQFPGGELELQKYIASKVIYPSLARENNIKGKVYVRFVITSTGEVDQVQIARPVDPLLDSEAVRVVKLLPKWTPGKQQGTPVSVWYTVPINFQLADQ